MSNKASDVENRFTEESVRKQLANLNRFGYSYIPYKGKAKKQADPWESIFDENFTEELTHGDAKERFIKAFTKAEDIKQYIRDLLKTRE